METMRVHPDSKRDKKLKNVPNKVPMSLLDEKQAKSNHGQTLKRLNERGGLGVLEMLDNIHKRKLSYRDETQADVDELNMLITNMEKQKYSTNEFAEKIVGKRVIPPNTLIFDQPCELDYHCPVCIYENVVNGEFDARLEWSEYNGFIWCSTCNKDFPSALCQPDIDKAIKTYLSCIQEAKNIK